MAIASTQDVVARWRPLSDSEAAVAATRLEDVERKIRRRIKDFDARLAVDADFRADVARIEADAVIRVLLNPDGKRSESIDDYAWTRDRAISDGQLRITASEWAELGVSVGARKAFSINTTPPGTSRAVNGNEF